MHPRQAFDTPLFPEDLATLQRVFDRLCDDFQWPRESAQSRRLARMLIDAYQAGNRDERLLLFAARAFVGHPPKQKSPA